MTHKVAAMNAKRRNCAFTLIELVIVVLIISILVSAAAPSLGEAYTDYKLKSAATRLLADLSHARNLAITTATRHAVVITDNGYLLTLLEEDGGESEAADADDMEPIKHPVTQRDWLVDLSEQSITITPSPPEAAVIAFDEMGAPSASGSIVLAAGRFSLKLTVQPHTGRVTIAAQ